MGLCLCGREIEIIYSQLPISFGKDYTIKQFFCRNCGVRKIEKVSKTGNKFV